MVAYRVNRSKVISQETYNRLRTIFLKTWHEERERSRALAREQGGGPNYYSVRRHRLSSRIIEMVLSE